jgi:hypothetical protein
MKVTALKPQGLFLIEPDIFRDARGSFTEIYNKMFSIIIDNIDELSLSNLSIIEYSLLLLRKFIITQNQTFDSLLTLVTITKNYLVTQNIEREVNEVNDEIIKKSVKEVLDSEESKNKLRKLI